MLHSAPAYEKLAITASCGEHKANLLAQRPRAGRAAKRATAGKGCRATRGNEGAMASLIRRRRPRQALEAGPKAVLGSVYFRITPANAQHGSCCIIESRRQHQPLSSAGKVPEMRAKLEPAFETRDVWKGSEVLVRKIVYRASPRLRLHLNCSLPFSLLRPVCCMRLSFKSDRKSVV